MVMVILSDDDTNNDDNSNNSNNIYNMEYLGGKEEAEIIN